MGAESADGGKTAGKRADGKNAIRDSGKPERGKTGRKNVVQDITGIAYESGPLSAAEVIAPGKMYRRLCLQADGPE